MMTALSLLLTLCLSTLLLAKAQKVNDHEIQNLPHFVEPTVPFRQYSGNIDLSTGDSLFYWYVESSDSPSTDPVLLWLNGGPGCSSLTAFFTENGPFVVNDDHKVELNPFSWNRKVNVLYLEAPAGVGFSKAAENEVYNDEQTTSRTYEFLRHFFDKYSELKNRDFFVAGESYGGMYVPALVDKLVQQPIPGVKLAGFAVGNPMTDVEIDSSSMLNYLYNHALISLETHRALLKTCKGNELAALMFTPNSTTISAECGALMLESLGEADFTGINPYFLYGDTCRRENDNPMMQMAAPAHKLTSHFQPQEPLTGVKNPCAIGNAKAYLNLPEVQQAIHARAGVNWNFCNMDVRMKYQINESALSHYRNVLGKGLNILVYSGDADAIVNFQGTERWISTEGLNLNVTKKWEAWVGADDQVGGYIQEYDGLTFMTVKGAGHMVPSAQPLRALQMLECFVFDGQCDFEYPAEDQATMQASTVITGYSLSFVLLIGVLCGGAGVGAGYLLLRRRLLRSQYRELPTY